MTQDSRYIKYIADMEANDIPWRWHRGRHIHNTVRPAAVTSGQHTYQTITKATTVTLKQDDIEQNWILYP